jgi:hypothetical protein
MAYTQRIVARDRPEARAQVLGRLGVDVGRMKCQLGILPNQKILFIGEQVDLNSPTFKNVAKRIAAHQIRCALRDDAIAIYEYHLTRDSFGSNAGATSITMLQNLPIEIRMIDTRSQIDELSRATYKFAHPRQDHVRTFLDRIRELVIDRPFGKELVDEYFSDWPKIMVDNGSLADLCYALMRRVEAIIIPQVYACHDNSEALDRAFLNCGGLDFIARNWRSLAICAKSYGSARGVELSYPLYFVVDRKSHKKGVNRLACVFDSRKKSFVAINPHDGRSYQTISVSDVNNLVLGAWLRILALSAIASIEIAGGGWRYASVATEFFEREFGIPRVPVGTVDEDEKLPQYLSSISGARNISILDFVSRYGTECVRDFYAHESR